MVVCHAAPAKAEHDIAIESSGVSFLPASSLVAGSKRAYVGGAEVSGARNWGCRVTTDLIYRGMQTAVLENEAIRISILLDKGAEIFEFLYKLLDIDFMYLAPWGVKNPKRDVPSVASPHGPFLDCYSGGWQEIFPNGGPHAVVRGAAYGQHGDVSLTPWSYRVTADSADRVALTVSVRSSRTPLYLEKELSLERGSPRLIIKERMVNESPVAIDLMWGHHPAFGGILLEPGVRIDVPAKRLLAHGVMQGSGRRRLQPGQESDWPHGLGPNGEPVLMATIPAVPEGGCEEMAYLTELEAGWYAVTHPVRRIGFALRWDEQVFPYLWLWQQFKGVKDYPWWGRVHTFALEPWTSYPTDGLKEAIRRGTQLTLQGGESIETDLTAVVYEGLTAVQEVTKEGRVRGTP